MTTHHIIYLQQYDEDGNENQEVTWCQDRINDQDIAYVRADDIQAYIDLATAMQDALKTIIEGFSAAVQVLENYDQAWVE